MRAKQVFGRPGESLTLEKFRTWTQNFYKELPFEFYLAGYKVEGFEIDQIERETSARWGRAADNLKTICFPVFGHRPTMPKKF